MERNTIIFSGASHTFGLGLEWELDPILNSEEYLQKGVNLPIPRPDVYQKYWREKRWPTLVCNELGYVQYNVHDMENDIKIGGNAVETIWMMVRDEEKIKHILEKTKYVILEIGYIRWYDENLHGGKDGDKYPNTIQEMINLINNPKSDITIVSKTLQWIQEVDLSTYMNELYKKIFYLKEKYKEIEFLILPWHFNRDSIPNEFSLKENIIPIVENNKKYLSVYDFQLQQKIQVWNKAKAFNGNYQYNFKEDHGSIEGHRRVANIVIEHIKKLQNEKE
jgi:hypothetical protein